MDPQAIEQQAQELCLVYAIAQHEDPEGIYGLGTLSLGERLGPKYTLQQDEWGLAA